ncbi:MAG: amino acid permease [Planctomycetaceae bacterium]|nr:amino acid permease [Planctomycetaceae bacterium]
MSSADSTPGSGAALKREVGVFGAVMMGLGSIIGTGVFVSIGVATGAAGPSVILALVVAAFVALCNGLSTAQLAASHPVSGGAYEYGYRWLNPSLGFTAGWMFLCAKSASAATAALGFAGYLRNALVRGENWNPTLLAVGAIFLLTVLSAGGIKRAGWTNAVIVSVTLVALATFVLAGLPLALQGDGANLSPFFAPIAKERSPLAGFLEACALLFVAYTGYGRIATLGEEIREPRRSIPLAISVTLFLSMTLYVAVGFIGVAAVGPAEFAVAGVEHAAPLEVVAQRFPWAAAAPIVGIGAVTAMLGVLLNLILGLSRVVLAMGRRGDLPTRLGQLDASATPRLAIFVVGAGIAALASLGSVKTTWSFSAFTVLVYYAITNLAALRLPVEQRRYPRPVAWIGLAACLFLAFWVETGVWLFGLGLIVVGLIWHRIRKPDRLTERSSPSARPHHPS